MYNLSFVRSKQGQSDERRQFRIKDQIFFAIQILRVFLTFCSRLLFRTLFYIGLNKGQGRNLIQKLLALWLNKYLCSLLGHTNYYTQGRQNFYNIQSRMKQVNQLHYDYQRIQKIQSRTLKKMMLEALKQQLLQMELAFRDQNVPNNEKQQITQTIETNTSHLSIISNSLPHDFSSDNRILPSHLTGNDELQELQGRILKKQKLKIAYNQAIEEQEEKYFDMQSTIYFQQEKIQRLDKQIAKKSYEISKISVEESVQIKQKDEQPSSFAHKFICFFLN